MALQDLPGTFDFLNDAAHLLRLTAPETSAHLMGHRGQLLHHRGISQTETQRQHVCGACGEIMIPGQGSTMKVETRRARHKTKKFQIKKMANPFAIASPSRVLNCDRCQRVTEVALNSSRPAARRRVTAVSNPRKNRPAEEPKPTANVSSKKRAKNRKTGLQALLSGQQQQPANPLSLAHFMKK
ncbi:hypothetical protein G7046_g1761 [Stylonectria norvegica]|nr:hypothetical protein G7046_g1761 [Stylonectria norvegica]